MAALSSIPWVGILVSAAKDVKADDEANQQTYLLRIWIEQHQRRFMELGLTLQEMQKRFDNFGAEIDEHLQSEAYLAIVRKLSGPGIRRTLPRREECWQT